MQLNENNAEAWLDRYAEYLSINPEKAPHRELIFRPYTYKGYPYYILRVSGRDRSPINKRVYVAMKLAGWITEIFVGDQSPHWHYKLAFDDTALNYLQSIGYRVRVLRGEYDPRRPWF